MKDWTGQQYDAEALADPASGRGDYDAGLLRDIDPRVSLNISGAVGGHRPAARCRTGFVLSADGTCDRCGAETGETCRSHLPGTAGDTVGNEEAAPKEDPMVAQIRSMLGVPRP